MIAACVVACGLPRRDAGRASASARPLRRRSRGVTSLANRRSCGRCRCTRAARSRRAQASSVRPSSRSASRPGSAAAPAGRRDTAPALADPAIGQQRLAGRCAGVSASFAGADEGLRDESGAGQCADAEERRSPERVAGARRGRRDEDDETTARRRMCSGDTRTRPFAKNSTLRRSSELRQRRSPGPPRSTRQARAAQHLARDRGDGRGERQVDERRPERVERAVPHELGHRVDERRERQRAHLRVDDDRDADQVDVEVVQRHDQSSASATGPTTPRTPAPNRSRQTALGRPRDPAVARGARRRRGSRSAHRRRGRGGTGSRRRPRCRRRGRRGDRKRARRRAAWTASRLAQTAGNSGSP